jgi:hypothetical protein
MAPSPQVSTTARVIVITLSFLIIVMNAWFLYYIEQIKAHGCSCAYGWRRTFVQASLIVFIVLGIVGLLFNWRKNVPLLGLLLSLLSLAYIVITRQFIHQVKKAHCECAETEAFVVLDWLNFFQIVLLAAVVFLLVLSLIAIASTARPAKAARR